MVGYECISQWSVMSDVSADLVCTQVHRLKSISSGVPDVLMPDMASDVSIARSSHRRPH